MRFTEVVLQGVRSFSQTHRFPLGDGFTVFVGGTGAGKTTFIDLLINLLFPAGNELATTAFTGPAGETCRAALTLDDGKGQVYRLVKDLLKGSTALTRFDAGSGQFAPVSSTPAEILQYLSSTLHLPQQDVFEGIYLFRPSGLPSAAKVSLAPAGMDDQLGVGMPPGAMGDDGGGATEFPGYQGNMGGGGGGFPGFQGGSFDDGGDPLPDDPDEIRKQIEVLTKDLANVRMVDDLQFKLDGLQSELFELDQKNKGVTDALKRVEQSKAELDKFNHLAELPGDFENRVRSYKQDKERHLRDLKRLKEDRARWEKQASQSEPVPLKSNRNFVLGLAGGLTAIGAGAAGFFVWEPLRWIALADILFFGIVLIASMRHIDASMGVERAKARLQALDERREKLERQFELESSIVRRTMEQVKVEAPEQVLEMYTKRNKVAEALQAAEQELAKQRAQAGGTSVDARRDEVQAEIDELEGQLAGMGGMMMSTNEMESRLGQLRDKLAYLEAGGSPGQAPGGGGDAGAMLGVGAPPGAMGFDAGEALGVGAPPGAMDGPDEGVGFDPFAGQGGQAGAPSAGGGSAGAEVVRRMIKLAEDLFLVDLDRLNASVSARAAQFLGALSSNALGAPSFDERGEVQVLLPATGAQVPLADLPAAQQDLVYLALKVTFIEAFSQKHPIPVFCDDLNAALPETLHEMLGRILAGIGRGTQVVLLSSQAGMAQHATASFSL